ncbi:MAG: ImmA/IrrE family metallo-endopeptidase [Betaproteobacteria bacterium]|nr:MAG: ImmA/IrrE family metallo-endopeptidase [Betaproteobacteria bacterium]
MKNAAGAIRRATLAAARLHRNLGLQAYAEHESGRIDVFDAIARLGVPLIFKPLEGLLGSYLSDPTPGILVTTKQPLNVQRFTAAHELGHHQLRHKPSFDDETVISRTPFNLRREDDAQETEAEAFAAAFLLPRWLVGRHCERQGWDDEALHRPEIVYQLALRTGTSYTAACWTLHRYNILTPTAASQMADIEPRRIKQILLGEFRPHDDFGDVWLLTERDAGMRIEGGPSDHFVMRLPEHSAAGYLWELEEPPGDAFKVVSDGREDIDSEEIVGGPTTRRIITQSLRRHTGAVRLSERRPWQPTKPLAAFSMDYDLTGAELEGWSRAERRYRLEAA